MFQSFGTCGWIKELLYVTSAKMPCDKGTPDCHVDVWGVDNLPYVQISTDITAHDKFYQDFSVCYFCNKVQMWQSRVELNIIPLRILNAIPLSNTIVQNFCLKTGLIQ